MGLGGAKRCGEKGDDFVSFESWTIFAWRWAGTMIFIRLANDH